MPRNGEHSIRQGGAGEDNQNELNDVGREIVNPDGGPNMEFVEAMDVELNKSLDKRGDLEHMMIYSRLLENAQVACFAGLSTLEKSEEKMQMIKETLPVFKNIFINWVSHCIVSNCALMVLMIICRWSISMNPFVIFTGS